MDKRSRKQEIGISQPRPKPYEPVRRPRIIIVDDFGEMKSGEYLKILVRLLSIIIGVSIVAGALFYYIYPELSREAVLTKESLVLAQKKINELTREKELLMARLVMSGKDPVLKKENEQENTFAVERIEEKSPVSPEPEEKEKINTPLQESQEKIRMNPLSNKIGDLSETPIETEIPKIIEKTVDLEKFSVIKDGATGDLLVRFDIRNISKEAGDVSGRIFIVLKSDNDFEDQMLVVPTAAIKNGIPSEYRKGQYFSIANFKTVKFRIKHPGDPEFYKKASVFVFNEQADLIFEKVIDITDAVESTQ
ncbi:hypothetical protein [Desulfobacula sp.]|uniref:hypothetical protein n=1 Tax=Desulfobacula sp. TaxID=2593537 RepID=UPI001ECF58FA|nr:hypothetical protein [Desulfobacula sp.]